MPMNHALCAPDDARPDNVWRELRGQRRDKPQQAADWRAVVREDVKTEQQQPPWPFTCYAHQRGGPNDMAGDFSYEEVSLSWHNDQLLAHLYPNMFGLCIFTR